MAAVAVENQRQYHNTTSAYVLPNDIVEQKRLDAQAEAIVEMIGGVPCMTFLHANPKVLKAVDVGCGTGVATLQIAGHLASAKVYGVDISPVPDATKRLAPSNVSWAIGNVLDVDHESPADDDTVSQKIFAPSSLDYIFGRMLFLGINDWSKYFSVVARSLAPGGIIEHQDLDWKFYRVGTSECLSDNWEWHKLVVAAAQQSGLSTQAGSDVPEYLRREGLEIVSVENFEFSFVPSAKTPNSQAMGRYVQAKLLPNYPELLRKMLGSQGIEGEELARLTRECLHDITSEEGVHQKYTVTVARKL